MYFCTLLLLSPLLLFVDWAEERVVRIYCVGDNRQCANASQEMHSFTGDYYCIDRVSHRCHHRLRPMHHLLSDEPRKWCLVDVVLPFHRASAADETLLPADHCALCSNISVAFAWIWEGGGGDLRHPAGEGLEPVTGFRGHICAVVGSEACVAGNCRVAVAMVSSVVFN